MLQAYLDDEMANFVWPGRLPLSLTNRGYELTIAEGGRMVGFRTHYEADRS